MNSPFPLQPLAAIILFYALVILIPLSKWSSIYYYLLVNVYTHFYLTQDSDFNISLFVPLSSKFEFAHVKASVSWWQAHLSGRLAVKGPRRIRGWQNFASSKFASFNRCVATFRSCNLYSSFHVFLLFPKLGCQSLNKKDFIFPCIISPTKLTRNWEQSKWMFN